MQGQLVVKTKNDGKVYEISELVNSVSYTDKLNDGCSKLEFSYIKDSLVLNNGDVLWFKYNNDEIFFGYVFKVSRNAGNEISITAYDQLRYAKGKDYLYLKGDTLKDVVNKMCLHFNFIQGYIAPTEYMLATQVFDGDAWLDIVYSCVSDTLMSSGKKYCLRDEFGKVTLRDMDDLRLNLILGEWKPNYNMLYIPTYDFSQERSIDDDFYNQIIILTKQKDKAQYIVAKDETSIKKYGMLQYYETMSDSNKSQAKLKADTLLKLYKQETETMTLECLGDTRIRAGTSFYIYMDEIGMNKQSYYVKQVTHEFIPVHKMSVEVAL